MTEQEYSLDEFHADALKKFNETENISGYAIWVQGLINYIEYLEALLSRSQIEPIEEVLQ